MKKFVAVFFVMLFSFPLLCEEKKEDEKKPKTPYDETVYNWSRTFAEVLQKTGEKHYKVADAEKCMINAIDAFLSCLDPHSGFLDPKTYKNMLESTSGQFFGIGIVIDNTRRAKDKFLTIIDTIPGGPSDKAGVMPYDKIIEIEDKSIEGMTTDEATRMLKGERDTVVQIKVVREGKPDLLTFDITRDVVKEQSSLSFYIKNQNIYYIALNTFSSNSAQQIEALLKKAKKKKYKALILDLRNNSGGLLNSAIDIAGLFLEKNSPVVVTKDKNHQVTERYNTNRQPVANGQLPIFILINNYTASAAEILAGALKIHSENIAKLAEQEPQNKMMVFLVGEKSFGKGSVQEVIPVSNNCAVKITTSLYYLPDDTTIQGSGIEPDFVIEKKFPPTEQMSWFTKFYGRESALEGSIKSDDKKKPDDEKKKKKKKDKKEPWVERAKKMLAKDNQLREAITLINIFDKAKTQCPGNVTTRLSAIEYIKKVHVTNDELTMIEMKV